MFNKNQPQIDKHQSKSIFLCKISHFYPLWGAYRYVFGRLLCLDIPQTVLALRGSHGVA